MRRLFNGALVGLIAVATVAGPTAAGQSEHGYGATARCKYTATQSGNFGWTEALLKRIVVRPPTVFAKKSGAQQVGWRFIVRRSLDREAGTWRITYRSPIQKKTATGSAAASFDAMRVGVSVPNNVEDQGHVWYRVKLKIFWYRADGSIGSSTWFDFTQYRMVVDGEDYGVWALDDFCPGLARQFFN